MRSPRPLHAVALAVSATLLTACDGAPEASTMPTPAPSAITSSAPVPPAAPATADRADRRGAEAFVDYYVNVLNYVTFGGDQAAAKRLDTGRCTSCDRMLDAIAQVYASGGNVTGGEWAIEPVGGTPSTDGFVVDVRISYTPQRVTPSRGAQADDYAGGQQLATFELKRENDAWLVDAWSRAE